MQALEANIKILQTRIRELELVQDDDDVGIMLHQPYRNPEGSESEDETVVRLPMSGYFRHLSIHKTEL